jgi:O-antigen/teichoic acid export membrane protein
LKILKRGVSLLNLSKLAKDSLIYGLGTTINRFVSLLLLPILTSYLTPNDYGVISQLTTMALFLSPIISLGLGSSIGICYFAKNNEESKLSVIRGSLTVLLISASISTFTLWLFSDQIGYILFKSEAYQWHIAFCLINLGFGILIIPLQQYLQFNRMPKVFAWQSLLVNLITIVFSLLLVIYL